MSACIVTGDDRTIIASLTIDKSATTAGAALIAAATIRACLVNAATRAALTPVYVIDVDAIDGDAGTVNVTIPAEDTADLDPAVATVLEIEMTDGQGQRLTWPDLGPILIKRGAIV